LLQLRDSPDAELRVLEQQGRRSLLVDGGIHTQVDSETRAPLLPYAIVGELAAELYPSGSRLLLVGLGGGSVARLFTRSGWKVEAVEIDSAVTGFAHQFFGLGDRDAVVHHEDGRRFLATTKDRWDVIFLDAFGSASQDLGGPVASLAEDYEHWRVVTRLHAWDNRFAPEPGWGPVLTDDLNPSDLWAEETNQAARKALHSEFALGGSW